MKKNYIILLVAILFSGITIAQEAQKNFINYQGVARNGADQLLANESMTLGIALKMGSATGASVYAENHSVTTDANGVFSLKIGNGDTVSGDFDTIPWGSEATFVTVLVNGSEIGTTEMMAVPYALSSGDGSQSASEVPYNNAGSGLAATNAQEAIDELVGSGAVDADADPTNEIQTISFDAATNEINLTDGGTITIPIGGTDADADPTNELQTISFDAGTNEINLTDGGTITIPSGGTDADADPTNEFQILSFDAGTNALSLSDGNSVTIPSGGTDADADPTNEIQMISFDAGTNELSLTDGGTVTIPSGGADADADPTNELQDISLSGTDLSISEGSTVDLSAIIPPGGTDDQNAAEVPFDNAVSGLAATDTQAAIEELAAAGLVNTDDQNLTFDAISNTLEIEDGNTVDLSSLAGGGSSLWAQNGSTINYSSGNVGIGIANPVSQQHVHTSSDLSETRYTTELTGEGINDGLVVHMAHTPVGPLAGIINYEDGPLLLGTNGTNRLFITANGNISIGGLDPTAKLDVDGDIRSRDLEGIGQRNVMADADGNLVIGAGGGGSSLWTQDGSSITYTSGRVGIGPGSESSNALLEVAGGANSEGILNVKDTEIVGRNLAINGFGLQGRFDGADASLSLNRNGGSIYMGGDVGIGLTGIDSPNATLDVDGNIRSRDLTGGGNVLADADGNLVIGAGDGGSSLWSENGDNIYFNPGNVGIGTDDPEAPLDIELESFISINTTSATATNYMQFNNSTGAVGYSGVWSNERDMDFGTNGSNSDGKVHLVTRANPKLTVAPDGNVGIGTETPTAKLDVVGDIKTSGEVHGPTTGTSNMIPIAHGRISSTGTIVAGSNNFTVTRSTTGRYFIVIPGMTDDETRETVIVATRINFVSPPGFIGGGSGFTGGNPALIVFTHDMAGAAENISFSFVAYIR